jgi:MFS transporter, FHS family, glucose/mannose:H+ symporter
MPSLPIIMAYLSLLVLGLADNIRGPIFPELIQQFALSDSKAALFFSFTSTMTLVSGFLTQYLMNRIGQVRTLQFSLVILTFALLGIGLSENFLMVLFFAIFLGIGIGTMGVAQNVLVIMASPAEKLQQYQSGLHSMYGLASLLAPLVVYLNMKVSSHWQSSFISTAVVSFVCLVVTFLFPFKISDNIVKAKEFVAKKREQIYFAFILAFYVAVELLVSTRIALYVRREFAYDLNQSSFITSAFFLFLLLGRLVFVFWHPPVSLRKQMTLSLCGTFVFCILGIALHPYFLALSGLAMAPFYPLTMTAASRLFSSSLNVVTSYCIAFSGITVVFMHMWVGWASDLAGLKIAFLLGPLFAVVALAMILLYPRFFNREIP